MRIANLVDRAALVVGEPGAERAVDLAIASGGRLGPALPDIYLAWDDVVAWVADRGLVNDKLGGVEVDRSALGAPSPAPRQVFAVGLNYHQHAAESGFDSPTTLPPIFTKYVSSFSGPDSEVAIPAGGNVDWEVELVVIMGREASRIDAQDAWLYVAGLTVGQDISERISQFRGAAAQFGLSKSFAGFSPQGPWLVTPDELADPDDLELGCAINGEEQQKSRTSDLIFSVAAVIAALSETVTLYPGDVIFTGTPAGVGVSHQPPRFLQPGDSLHSWVGGIGELNQTFVEDSA
ncbi:Ureidoglycolate lyase [Mycolicibacterium vanbaalenii]|uniref:Ureidoglycolate lyase n=1 Tax=Mycolicibacterium vanbaalenii TaxID=110539 RepID=A0A5S9R6T5_MYCVN|nr:fumarylacetoacetate hydrolase family protein [Mycolicibacterium vanbaalenii]CAA0130008.1 Ureidoglycolate lyase [Mycolicibacterium vanbaalenii]